MILESYVTLHRRWVVWFSMMLLPIKKKNKSCCLKVLYHNSYFCFVLTFQTRKLLTILMFIQNHFVGIFQGRIFLWNTSCVLDNLICQSILEKGQNQIVNFLFLQQRYRVGVTTLQGYDTLHLHIFLFIVVKNWLINVQPQRQRDILCPHVYLPGEDYKKKYTILTSVWLCTFTYKYARYNKRRYKLKKC